MALLRTLWGLKASFLYVMMIPVINWAFAGTPFLNVALPEGGVWNPFSVLVGLVLVVRDFAQREIGHRVFVPLAIAVALSYVMAPPQIATASALAFLTSELVDWAVYSFTKKPLSSRVLISSAAGVPVDTAVFLIGANLAVPGFFNRWTFATMIVSKLAGIAVIWAMLRRRETAKA